MLKRTLLLLVACVYAVQARSALESSILRIIKERSSPAAVWGIHVVDLRTGSALADVNGSTPAMPASNTKLFSTALALRRLGPDYRHETRLLAAVEPDSSGTVAGNLTLVGAGEPLPTVAEFAQLVYERGVRHVTGDIVGDDTLYPWQPYPDGWTVDDTIYDYGAPVSALSLGGNLLRLALAPAEPGLPALLSLDPPVEFYTVYNGTLTGSAAPLEVSRLPGSRVVLLTGGLSHARSLSVALDDPALFAAYSLAQALRDRGVVIDGAARAHHRLPGAVHEAPSSVVVVRHSSPPLAAMVTECNKESNNLYAELLLRESARVKKGDALLSQALEEMDAFLAELGIDRSLAYFEDGSGLSRKTLIAPRAISRLLAAMAGTPEFVSSLPVGGEDGSLKSRFRGVPSAARIHAKTGSLRHVVALSGYIDRRVAFSILANHSNAPDSELRAVVDRIAVEILQRSPRK